MSCYANALYVKFEGRFFGKTVFYVETIKSAHLHPGNVLDESKDQTACPYAIRDDGGQCRAGPSASNDVGTTQRYRWR